VIATRHIIVVFSVGISLTIFSLCAASIFTRIVMSSRTELGDAGRNPGANHASLSGARNLAILTSRSTTRSNTIDRKHQPYHFSLRPAEEASAESSSDCCRVSRGNNSFPELRIEV